MDSYRYFKLDLRLMWGALKYYSLLPLVLILLFTKDSAVMGLNYLFFFLIIAASTPFSIESIERSERLYFMLPSKISSMVLGRYLFLIITALIIWIADISIIAYLLSDKSLNIIEAYIICISGLLATIACFIQYPIYYKLGMSKGRLVSKVMYLIPAFAIFAFPTLLESRDFFNDDFINTTIRFASNNRNTLLLFGIFIMIAFGFASYLLSCYINEKKELL